MAASQSIIQWGADTTSEEVGATSQLSCMQALFPNNSFERKGSGITHNQRHAVELLANNTLYPCSFPLTEEKETGSQCTSASVLLWTMICTLSGADKGTAEIWQRSNIVRNHSKSQGRYREAIWLDFCKMYIRQKKGHSQWSKLSRYVNFTVVLTCVDTQVDSLKENIFTLRSERWICGNSLCVCC